MVTFRLIQEDELKIIYWYFPEGKEDRGHGTIVIDKVTKDISFSEIAPDDYERDISAKELNGLAEAINEMIREAGRTNFVEKTTESVHSVYYGDHAVREIVEDLQNGKVPKNGTVMWY